MAKPRILVTNDDGIDSVGLHVLARTLAEIAEVTIVAPDQEYSGAGAAIGALHLMTPEAHLVGIDGIDTAWAVNGPPALCVMFARLGAFGPLPDLIVSGINPGANVGRSVYHSGTIGATLTGRNGGISGLAVSQAVKDIAIEGQGWDEMLIGQKWHTAAAVACSVVEAMLAEPPAEASVLNLNVPNTEIDEIAGWQWTEVGQVPPRAIATAALEPKEGHEGAFHVRLEWGEERQPPPGTDTAAIQSDKISVTWLSRITALPPSTPVVETALDRLVAVKS